MRYPNLISWMVCGLLLGAAISGRGAAAAGKAPRLDHTGGATRLMVEGQPWIILGGELHNSSSSSLDYLRPIWPRLKSLNLNTVIASLSWELVEPEEGRYDFTLLDGIVEAARRHELKLVLIWFGTWKNTDGSYAPGWVKTNLVRFPRCQHRPGVNTTQFSAFAEATLAADARAFAAVMRRLREVDGQTHTVLMMQVENEAGVMPVSRDRSELAEEAHRKPVPEELMNYLKAHKASLIPELRAVWASSNYRESGTWSEVFGDTPAGDEVFQAWHIARFIGRVAEAGKAEYPLPMYANAWLVQQRGQEPGKYPSGGPVAKVMDVWRAAAPAIDFIAPDIYLEDFKNICAEYTQSGNPLFIPEASRDERAGLRAYYAIGHHHALGFAPFGIDSLPATNVLGEHYAVLQQLAPVLANHLGQKTLRGFLQYRDERRLELDLGDYRAEIEYRSEDPGKLGGGLLIATAPDTFLITGVNYTIRFAMPREKSGQVAWLTIDEGVFRHGQWVPGRRLNGDEAGYRLNLGPRPRILLARVYAFPEK